MKVETVGKILKTSDYSEFKSLEGNREIVSFRKKKVKESIQQYGWISGSCILVNEKYEIIDGQARFEVCKELGLPIYFTIGNGIGIKECAAINISSKWRTSDYIDMYSSTGNTNYKYLQILCKKFPDFTESAIANISRLSTGGHKNLIKEGTFKMDQRKFEQTERSLAYVKSCENSETIIEGYKNCYIATLGMLYIIWENDPKLFDKERLKAKLLNYSGTISASKTDRILEKLTEIYNYRSKSAYIDFITIYRNLRNGRYSWSAEYKEK